MTIVTKPNCTNPNVEVIKWAKSKFGIDLTSVVKGVSQGERFKFD